MTKLATSEQTNQNGIYLGNKRKGFRCGCIFFWRESLSNQMIFMVLNISIERENDFVDPFTSWKQYHFLVNDYYGWIF